MTLITSPHKKTSDKGHSLPVQDRGSHLAYSEDALPGMLPTVLLAAPAAVVSAAPPAVRLLLSGRPGVLGGGPVACSDGKQEVACQLPAGACSCGSCSSTVPAALHSTQCSMNLQEIAAGSPAVPAAPPARIVLPTLDSCAAMPGTTPTDDVLARGIVLCVGVCGRPPSILLTAALVLSMDEAGPPRAAVPARLLRLSAPASQRAGLQAHGRHPETSPHCRLMLLGCLRRAGANHI